MNRTLLGLAALTAAILIGDGIRAAGRAILVRAVTDRMAFDASMEIDDDDDDSSNRTYH